jgi:hypothetical protein
MFIIISTIGRRKVKVLDGRPEGEISLRPAVKCGYRFVESNWDLQGLRGQVDRRSPAQETPCFYGT